MDWQINAGWLMAGLVVIAQWAWRNRLRVLQAAAEAAAFAEKYREGATEAELEEMAVLYVRSEWPGVNELAVRLAIRKLCARRRAAGDRLGMRR